MNSRWLYISVATLAMVVFASNFAAVHGAALCPSITKGTCECTINVISPGTNPDRPSCSVRTHYDPISAVFGTTGLQGCTTIEPGSYFDTIVMCDAGAHAKITCGTGDIIDVPNGKASGLSCGSSGDKKQVTASHYGGWTNNVQGVRGGSTNSNNGIFRTYDLAGIAHVLSGRRLVGNSLKHLLDDTFTPVTTILAETEVLTIFAGDGGFSMANSLPRVTLTQGQATVTSLCDGTTAQVQAPAVVDIQNNLATLNLFSGIASDPSLGTCPINDFSGVWRGGYWRPNASGALETIPMVMTLNGQTGTVVAGSDTLNVTSVSQSGGYLSVNAQSQTSNGTLSLRGTYTKGGWSSAHIRTAWVRTAMTP